MPIGGNLRFCLLRRVCTHFSRSVSPSEILSCMNRHPGRFTKLRTRQDGFTLTESMVTISILGILMAMTTGAFSYYLSAKAVETSASELQTQMREANALAVATGNTYRLDFSATHTYTMQRRQGSEWINVRGPINLESAVNFSAAQPPNFGDDEPRYLNFYAKGTCENGSLVINGRFSKTKTVTLDGETVNVRIT